MEIFVWVNSIMLVKNALEENAILNANGKDYVKK